MHSCCVARVGVNPLNTASRSAVPQTFPGAIGTRIVAEICQDCWGQWVKQQTMLINHYGLNVMDPQARAFLTKNMTAFFF